jgi:hypothetical protein
MQSRRGQGWRIKPFVRAFERGQLGLTRRLAGGKSMKKRDLYPWGCHRLRDVHVHHNAGNRSSDCGGEYRGYQELVRFHR